MDKMKAQKTKAQLLSDYLSKQMKEDSRQETVRCNPRKYKDELKASRKNKSRQKDPSHFSDVNGMLDPHSSFSKLNDTTQASALSHRSYSPAPFQKDLDANSDFKDSQLEVNSNYERQSVASMPTKMDGGNQESSQNQFFRGVNFMTEPPNYSQGNMSVKLENDRNHSNENGQFMGGFPQMGFHSQMVPQPFPGSFHPMQFPPPFMSQQFENMSQAEENRSGTATPKRQFASNEMQVPHMMHPPGMEIQHPRMIPMSPHHRGPMFGPMVPPHMMHPRMLESMSQPGIIPMPMTKVEGDAQSEHPASQQAHSQTPMMSQGMYPEFVPNDAERAYFERFQMMDRIRISDASNYFNPAMVPILNKLGMDGLPLIGKSDEFVNQELMKMEEKQEAKEHTGVHYPDDKPVLQNIVSTCDMCCPLNLQYIATSCKNTEFNPKRFAAAIMKIRNPKTTALVFSSGKMVCTGAKSEELSKLAAKKFAKTIKVMGFPVRFTAFKIQNIVGSCDIGFNIGLEALYQANVSKAHYDPEIFPGLIYRVEDPKVVVLVFVSGKIVLTGAKSRDQIFDAYDKIYPILKAHKKKEFSFDNEHEHKKEE